MASSLTTLQFPSPYLQSHTTKKFKLKSTPIRKLNARVSRIKCSYSNGRKPESGEEEMTQEKRRRAELSAQIASGKFTVEQPSLGSLLVSGLAKLGVPSDFLEPLSNLINSGENYPKIPEAEGAISAIRSEAFFIPLYELYLTYGGIFRLTFGPKSFLIVSDPNIAKHILRDNAKAYSKGILAEILEFVMGTGLIPADGEVWRVRRRVIVPALHLKYVARMIGLFGEATDRMCKKLYAAAYNGEDVEMESLFSRLTLDIIGKSVFNYDFDSLTTDNGIVEAVYTVLREAEDRSVSPIPTWEIPIWKDISPRQKKVNEALKLINTTLDDLIAICKDENNLKKSSVTSVDDKLKRKLVNVFDIDDESNMSAIKCKTLNVEEKTNVFSGVVKDGVDGKMAYDVIVSKPSHNEQ
ncbi:protein LUTEIN DEFICIENT 5, chloroplastic-like [Bidens hawaiensis]|uniref:protein LUTEIN DEFICIENT 5, chloroplastic-like n=1 Tax=Bidens hawaiensis TaxID=980011 RepID=UPI00404B4887